MLRKNVRYLIAAAVAALLISGAIFAADTPAKYKVVVDVSSPDHDQWQLVLGNIRNIQKALGPENVKIEVVGYHDGLNFLLAKDNDLKEQMQKAAEAGVVFAACQNSMRFRKVTQAELVPFATTVDSGAAELVRKQADGWAYLKPGGK